MLNILAKVKSALKAQCKVTPVTPKLPQVTPEVPETTPEPPKPRQINQAGVDLIHSFESLELEAYPDPGSPLGRACTRANLRMRSYKKLAGWQSLSGAPWTIGWGHTGRMPDGTPVAPDKTVTKEIADAIFAADIAGFEVGVEGLVKVPVTDNQFAAVVSFAYNCGLGNLASSTLLRKLNSGDYIGASEEFPKWNKSGGQVLDGLTRRRKAEQALFLKGHP